RGDDGLLALAQEPGPLAGAVGGRADRHPVLVQRPGRRVRPVVPPLVVAAGISAESGRPSAAPDPGRGRPPGALGPHFWPLVVPSGQGSGSADARLKPSFPFFPEPLVSDQSDRCPVCGARRPAPCGGSYKFSAAPCLPPLSFSRP